MIVRIIGAAIDFVEALPITEINRYVGLAQEDHARRLKLAHDLRIAPGNITLVRFMAPRRWKASDIKTFLDRHRDAEQWLMRTGQLFIHSFCGLNRALEIAHRNRVHVDIEVLNPRNGIFHGFMRRNFAPADACRCFNCSSLIGQFWIGHIILPLQQRVLGRGGNAIKRK